jgi:hypothetical protein
MASRAFSVGTARKPGIAGRAAMGFAKRGESFLIGNADVALKGLYLLWHIGVE